MVVVSPAERTCVDGFTSTVGDTDSHTQRKLIMCTPTHNCVPAWPTGFALAVTNRLTVPAVKLSTVPERLECKVLQ